MKNLKLIILLTTLPITLCIKAQTNFKATIDGKVSDEKYKPLSGVLVFLRETENNNILDSLNSKDDGTFKFNVSSPGQYQILFHSKKGNFDSSFIFSIGQLYQSHNTKLVLSFVFLETQENLKSQRRQFGGSYSEWFTSVPGNLLVNLIAEYEKDVNLKNGYITGTTLNTSIRSVGNTPVTLFNSSGNVKVAETVSDASGIYVFQDIPEGIYYLMFDKNNSKFKGGVFEVKKGWKIFLKDSFRKL